MNRSPKISLAACILILAIASGIGWQERQRLTSARERNARVVAEAAALGIATTSGDKKDSVVLTKREREPQGEAAKREVAELLAMLEVMDAPENQGKDMEAGFQKIFRRLMALSPAGVELVIAAVVADERIDGETREGILGILLTKLCSESPQTLLKILPGLSGISPDKAEDQRVREMIATTALVNWGKTDPMAVARWIRTNEAGFPGGIDDGKKQGILAGTASRDPGMAFKLISEMGMTNQRQAILSITRAAKGPEGKTAALAGLRAYLATPDAKGKEEMLSDGIGQLAEGIFKEGFGPASKWLGSVGFSPAEMATVGSRLEYFYTIGETGLWLDWLGQNLLPEKADGPVGRIMGRWTEADYQAAGRWLAAAPEGPAKSASVQAYASTVSRYEPETAVQWAMTLPDGKSRDATLRQIHQNWPKEQVAARDAFAKVHGIE